MDILKIGEIDAFNLTISLSGSGLGEPFTESGLADPFTKYYHTVVSTPYGPILAFLYLAFKKAITPAF
jgi:hypothetical protein